VGPAAREVPPALVVPRDPAATADQARAVSLWAGLPELAPAEGRREVQEEDLARVARLPPAASWRQAGAGTVVADRSAAEASWPLAARRTNRAELREPGARLRADR
jgi:hypothetical protein